VSRACRDLQIAVCALRDLEIAATRETTPIAVKPPRPLMPPLNALRAFAAPARHESFAKAADELGVTPAAVSHQVKALEQWFGATLFQRKAQGLRLTEIGRAVNPGFSRAFDALGLAVQELRAAAPRVQLNIAALPSIAQLWLTPRLPGLRAAFPGIKPSIHALEAPPNFRREPFDLAIFFVSGEKPHSRAVPLIEDVIFPACLPEIAETLRTAADLGEITLLHDTTWSDDWPTWLAAAGAERLATRDGLSFSLYSLAVQAALDGAGVLMAHESLVAGPLAAGALVAPFRLKIKSGLSLSLLLPERTPAHVAEVVEWLAGAGAPVESFFELRDGHGA
jgi:LysR family glycine cleavage system transcriptional activator